MKFQNCILKKIRRMDGWKDARTCPKQYAPLTLGHDKENQRGKRLKRGYFMNKENQIGDY